MTIDRKETGQALKKEKKQMNTMTVEAWFERTRDKSLSREDLCQTPC